MKCWGYAEYGQLGNGAAMTATAYPLPQQVSGITSGATFISSNFDHTCAVVSGAARCWGENTDGQLGNNSAARSSTPVAVMGLGSGVVQVAAGATHSCALLSSGAVRCWGLNDVGQLGDGTQTHSPVPVQVTAITSGATAISAGLYHSCAVVSGALQCWGGNLYGELGINSNSASLVPVTVMGLSSGVTAVSAGDSTTCAIQSGAAKCWGKNGVGQLGNGMGGTLVESTTPQQVVGLTSGVTSIASGWLFGCAVHSGAAKCWGTNYDYSLGNGMSAGFDSNVPVNVTGLGSGTAAVAGGAGHTCALLTSGGLRCWGVGGAGALGDGLTDDSNVPVVVQFP